MTTTLNGTLNGTGAVLAAPDPITTALPEAPFSVTVKAQLQGYDTMITIRGHTGAETLPKLLAALEWCQAHGGGPTRPAAAWGAVVANDGAPTCPTHGAPMQTSKRGGWYCPAKTADDDGTGKPSYCKFKVKASEVPQ